MPSDLAELGVAETTPTSSWADLRHRSLPSLPPPVPTTVVVPHPDDEALLFGGLVAVQRARNVEVTIVAVTDGEAAYPDVDRAHLAKIRRREQEHSLARLGVSPSAIHRLHVPDGEVDLHLDQVTDAVARLRTPLVVAPWEHDHHCDHETCGRAAQIGAVGHHATVWSGLFWAWHHTDPKRMNGRELLHLPLESATRVARRTALGAHRSQLAHDGGDPVLTEAFLEPVTWHREYYVAPPAPSEGGTS